MKSRALYPSLALLTFTAMACGGSSFGIEGDGGAGDGVTADQAATDVANAYCNRAQACAPAYVTVGFGDVATCSTRLKATLLPSFGANGVTETPAQYEACAQALPNATCSDLLSRNLPGPCQPVPGTLADGAACAVDAQCLSAHCGLAVNAVCGTCSAQAGAGGGCNVDDDCQEGMTCQSGACAVYGAENASCDTTHPCRPDLGCVGGTCTTASSPGAACQASAECQNLEAAFCNPVAMVCQDVAFAAPNAPCGLVSGQVVLCTGPGSLCVGEKAPTYTGSCLPYAADGAACDPTNGPLCNEGAVCSGGKCVIPDPSQCM